MLCVFFSWKRHKAHYTIEWEANKERHIVWRENSHCRHICYSDSVHNAHYLPNLGTVRTCRLIILYVHNEKGVINQDIFDGRDWYLTICWRKRMWHGWTSWQLGICCLCILLQQQGRLASSTPVMWRAIQLHSTENKVTENERGLEMTRWYTCVAI